MKYFIAIAAFICLMPQVSLSQPSDATLTQDQSYLLEIPLVDFQKDPGIYQNVVLRAGETENSWTLVSADVGIKIESVQSVSVITTSEAPIQIFLKVAGTMGTLCTKVGKYAVREDGNSFEISLYYDPSSVPPPGVGCLDQQQIFSEIIQMPVYGLDAGEYSFTINDKLNGNFVLAADNNLP